MVMLVLILTLCVASLSGGLALLGYTERSIASTHLRAVQAGYAADAAIRLAIGAVSQAPESAGWPSGGMVPRLESADQVMVIAAGDPVDLNARTVELNRDAARRWPLEADTPQWRLAGWGRLPGMASSPIRVAVWVADDVMDGDGRPAEDLNGVLMIRAEAFGSRGAARAVLAHIQREVGGIRILSWREE